jgi:hypothetical protein
MMNCRGGLAAAFVLSAAMVLSGTVRATDDNAKGAARDLANEAKRDFDAGKFDEAKLKFQRAYQIAKVPTLAVWAARALVKRGQLVAASELYRQATLLAPNDLWIGNAQQQAQADAARELGELRPRIPRLCIRVMGAESKDVELTIDDTKISSALYGIAFPTDPGKRHLVGKIGGRVVEQTVELAEGDHKDALLSFGVATPGATQTEASMRTPSPAARPGEAVTAVGPAPSHEVPVTTTATGVTEPPPALATKESQRTWGWVAVGVGAAGLLTGIGAGIAVMSNSSLRDSCPNGTCKPSEVDSGEVSRYNLMRGLSTAGLIVGGIGVAVGVTLLLWTPRHDPNPQIAFWIGPSSAGVKGAF